MAKSADNNSAAGSSKLIPADCVSVLLMAIGNTSISKAQYDMMSALDGQRTASSFEHQFRSITQKAKELKARVEKGEKFIAVQPPKKRGAAAMNGGMTPPNTPPKRSKATPKPRGGKKTKAVDKSVFPSPTSDDLQGGDDLFASIKRETEFENGI